MACSAVLPIAVFVNPALCCTKNAQLVYITNVDLLFFLHWAKSAGVYEHSYYEWLCIWEGEGSRGHVFQARYKDSTYKIIIISECENAK
jgi:hypothetical protein